MGSREFLAAKVSDPDLRRAIEIGREERVSVLIEIEIPMPEIRRLPPTRENGVGRGRFVAVEPTDRALVRQQTSEAAAFLEGILKDRPKLLRAASAFVVRATGRQLGEIVTSPLVRAISPNRPLR